MKTENFLLWIFVCSAVLCLAACSDEYMPSDAEKNGESCHNRWFVVLAYHLR